MKKILKSILTLGFVAVVAFTGANAFFSDTETSVGNTFTAGDIDLQIDNTSYVIDYLNPDITSPTGAIVASTQTSWSVRDLTIERFFDFLDLKPGDFGEDTISVHVGSNDAWVCAAAQITEDNDNTYTEPEEVDDLTVLADPTTTDGELDDEVNFAFWADDGDNVYESDETIFLSGPMSGLGGAGQIALADSGSSILTEGGAMPGGSTSYIGKYWCYGTMDATPITQDGVATGNPTTLGTGFACSGASVDNASQTDVVVADLQFYAVQARNNDQFLCSQWIPDWPEVDQLPPVGAVLGGYTAPTCDATVSGAGSIQTAVDVASTNQTVCVDETYTGDGDDTAIRIETLGLTLAATSQGVALDVPVVLSNSNVTVTGFAGFIGQAESLAEQAAFYLDGDADGAELSYNTVTGGSGAAVLTETGAALAGGLITHNVLDGATQGLYLNPHTGSVTVEFNDFHNNVVGIGGLNGAVVHYNQFEHTTPASEAIGIDGSFDSNTATVNFNNFLSDMMINAYHATGFGTIDTTVDAENNYFSTSAASQTNDGIIDADPETGSQYPHN